ncbi:MAG: peptidylglycine alpha-amidating monooxygenase [Labilithrix sp.]|nr:peptidylglycine alpha-amidating monooxygenase [Labilithrix sp.]MCW5814699.1 peptidylglycine alpha-amidating monooxygenase [Labilithrix sp.]
MSLRAFAAFAAAVIVAAACGGTSAEAPAGPSQAGVIDLDGGPIQTTPDGPSGLPCDVDAILTTHCRKCHARPPQYGAPMPLLGWDDLQAPTPSGGKKVHEMVLSKVANDDAPMPPAPNARLSEAEKKTLSDWSAAGAPRSAESCATTPPPPPPDPVTGLSCTPNKTLAPAAPYEMPESAGDQYVCWGVDVTADTPTHIVGFAPRIDNTTITHHVVMYEAPSSYPSTPQPCDASAAVTWRMVLGWAPGISGVELPPEAGFPIAPAGTHYVVQMHYSNPQRLKGEKDSTKIEVCTAPPRQHEADVLAFGSQSFTIPAAPPPGGVFTRECSITVPSFFAGIHLFAAMPHMHKIGHAMTTTLTRQGGAPIDLGTMTSYDFNAQRWLPIDAVTQSGDVIRTDCSWKNTTGAPVKFGEKTADEMCYSFTMYYPRIASTLWSWGLPAQTASCVSRP